MNKCYLNFRTDMADERADIYKKVHNLSEIDGIKVESKIVDKIKVVTVDVLNENGKKAINKEIGKYITIEITNLQYINENEKQSIIQILAEQIKIIMGEGIKSIMVVGLGNANVTPDSLGPKVISYVNVTRQLIKYAKDLVEPNAREISAISPGVLGTTGIETEEILESIVNKTKPDMLIVIDSLASGSVSRVGNTIQMGNTGIVPGAGVANKRAAIDKNSLGIPVIAIGVPTVVDMATITNEAIDKLTQNVKEESFNYTNNTIDNEKLEMLFNLFYSDNRYQMISNVLHTENYIVTPKEIDDIIKKISEIIASGLNVVL